ncbi:MAG: ABC-F family ATP-binding cassette domain-containing protein, partial [Armatimonadetes bacterium]|nr:ABC-F family ATP-binding cassette domain-containing protein [Armatimonadota bacterium]
MPLLEGREIRRYFGPRTVLDGVSLVLERGERLGLVGANGSGKTTLCRLILQFDEPDEGSITLAAGARVGYLSQDPELLLTHSVLEEAMTGFEQLRQLEAEFGAASEAIGDPYLVDDPHELERRLAHQSHLLAELEAAGGFDYEQRMLATLGALGFGPGDLHRPVGQLSGGEKSRLALAKLLMMGCDLLLLDEPTNHLDIRMTEWLEGFLRTFPGGAIIVSHDRWFLDNVCHKIGELEAGALTLYHFGEGEAKLPPPDDPEFQESEEGSSHYGAYTHFVRVKAQRREAEWKAYATQQKELRRQEEWIRWKLNLRRQSHVAAARSRQKMLDKIERVERPADDLPVVTLNFEPRSRGPNDIAELRDLTFGYGRKPLFENLNLFVRRLQRVGIVGPNGCGKSSLLKLLLEELEPTEGVARLGATAEVGYYHQEHRDLDLESTPLEEIRKVVPDMPAPQIRGFLSRFLFFGDQVFRRVGSFSGGERSRLVLAKLIIARPNVLLLDEPTNHLDIPSREVLEEALRQFQGTIITVSHDRWFLDRICR